MTDRRLLIGGALLLCIFGGIIALRLSPSEKGPNPAPRPAPPGEPAEPPRPDAFWPVFRGNPGLVGTSPGRLSERLSLLWTLRTRGPVRSSPVLGEGRAYIGSDDGNLWAIDLSDGKKVWTFAAGSPVEAPPLLADGAVFFGCEDGTVYAVGAKDGAQRWMFRTEGKVVGSANRVTVDGKLRILIGSHDNMMRCFGAKDGTLLWSFETESYINGAPAVWQGQAVFGGCDSRVYLVDAATGKGTGAADSGSYIAASVAVAGDRAYVGHYEGEFLCVDLNKAEVIWKYAPEEAGSFFSCAAVGETRVVTGCRDGRVHCMAREDGKGLWTFETRGDVDSAPVICGDRVVAASTDGTLFVLRLEDGSVLWSFSLGAAVTGSPAVAGGMIVLGAEDGQVFAFGPGGTGPGKDGSG
jgi:outer membrane protein assembly factor BamB